MSHSRTSVSSFVFLLLLMTCSPVHAYLFSQTSGSGSRDEIRGVWLSPGYFGADRNNAISQMQITLDEYVKAGINTLMVMVKSTSGLVYYNSRIAPRDTAWNWDFFGAILEEAQKRHMVVHPWFCVFTESGMYGEVRQHPEWLIRSRKSELVGVVNPALPEVRRYEISLMTELAHLYPVDWIHLDYIRYPCEPTENYYSFDPQTRARFKEYSGEDPLSIKAMDSGNILWNEWIKWNGRQVEQFVHELKEALKKENRSVRISAAVFPDADNAKVLIGQDWEQWAKDSLIDMICPMLYTNNAGFFEQYGRHAVSIAQGRCQVCLGVGVGTSHNQNTPEGVLQQVVISRSLKANGVIFFSASSLKHEFLQALETDR
ncbi:MAG: family 10 glycosylhydrolase [Bacteroidota bacterium]